MRDYSIVVRSLPARDRGKGAARVLTETKIAISQDIENYYLAVRPRCMNVVTNSVTNHHLRHRIALFGLPTASAFREIRSSAAFHDLRGLIVLDLAIG